MGGLPFYNRLSILGISCLSILTIAFVARNYIRYQAERPTRSAKAEITAAKASAEKEIALQQIESAVNLSNAQLKQAKASLVSPTKVVTATIDGYPDPMSQIAEVAACTNILNPQNQQIGAAQNGVFYPNNSCTRRAK